MHCHRNTGGFAQRRSLVLERVVRHGHTKRRRNPIMLINAFAACTCVCYTIDAISDFNDKVESFQGGRLKWEIYLDLISFS